jgi:hypothetical protein
MAKKESQDNKFIKIDFFLIGFLLLLALILRLYKINIPLTDHHSWRQVDTAAVARNFVKDGFDLFHPKYDDLSNIQSGKYNPQGYRFVEFPIYNAIFAFLYKKIPILPLEIYGRLVTIFFSLILILVIYYLVLKEEGRLTAFLSSLIFSVMPFFVFYSRVILPEMTALSLAFLSFLSLYLYSKNLSIIYYLLSIIFLSLSLLIKPTTIFFFLPLIYIFYKKFGLNLFKKVRFYFYFLLSFTPLVLWRVWMMKFPQGIPSSEWLLFQVNTYQGLQNIFFRPAFFRWIFEERILNLILGGYLVVFFIIGLLKKPKGSCLLFWITIASLIYLFTFQGGNVQHDYYQILILPVLAIFTGVGINFFLTEKRIFFNLLLNILFIIVLLGFSWFFSFYQVRDFYSYSQDLVNIAKIVKTLIPAEAKIVTDTTGDTTLLYLSERRGYPAPTTDFETLKKQGMEYFVTMNGKVADDLKEKFQLIFDSDKVYIFKL